jgi:hypothetical protein
MHHTRPSCCCWSQAVQLCPAAAGVAAAAGHLLCWPELLLTADAHAACSRCRYRSCRCCWSSVLTWQLLLTASAHPAPGDHTHPPLGADRPTPLGAPHPTPLGAPHHTQGPPSLRPSCPDPSNQSTPLAPCPAWWWGQEPHGAGARSAQHEAALHPWWLHLHGGAAHAATCSGQGRTDEHGQSCAIVRRDLRVSLNRCLISLVVLGILHWKDLRVTSPMSRAAS